MTTSINKWTLQRGRTNPDVSCQYGTCIVLITIGETRGDRRETDGERGGGVEYDVFWRVWRRCTELRRMKQFHQHLDQQTDMM